MSHFMEVVVTRTENVWHSSLCFHCFYLRVFRSYE